jgi:hypothetical protein
MKRLARLCATVLLCVAAALAPARATITSSANKTIAAGNGTQTAFSFSFVADQASDIWVVFTDAGGNQTTLTQGPGPTQYQLTLNAAVAPALWGTGGVVTYDPNGAPIALGTTLTIYRALPYTQATSLQNQASFGQYAQAAEMGLDGLAMQIQQLGEAQARVISAPIVDPSTLDLTLPAAAQRANQVLGFDGSGNVIVVSTLPSGTVSSAMAGVVNASSLANGRTALGLGSIATLSPNLGLQEGVSAGGALDVDFASVQDASSQAVTSSFHLTQRFATGGISYGLPASSTLWNGFGFWVTALTATVALAPNSADSFAGSSNGQSTYLPPGASGFVVTNGAGTWWLKGAGRIGLGAPLNLGLSATVSGNALTVAAVDAAGAAPSTTSPVLLAFRSATAATGTPVLSAVTGALSFSIAAGSTMGCQSGALCRLWIVLMNNAGTVALCAINAVSGTTVVPLDEGVLRSSAPGTSGGNSAQTYYCNASSVSNAPMRIVGYLDIAVVTAGTWASGPTYAQLFGPGIHKPGERFNPSYMTTTGATSCSSSAQTETAIAESITPLSGADLVAIEADAAELESAVGLTVSAQVSRGTAPLLIGVPAVVGASGTSTQVIGPGHMTVVDAPGTVSPVTYAVYCKGNSGTGGSTGGSMLLEEIMGALDPANQAAGARPARKAA